MSMDPGPRGFRTKRGKCVVEDDVIRLESSAAGYLRHLWHGNRLLFLGFVAGVIFAPVVLILQVLAGNASPAPMLLGAMVVLLVLLAVRAVYRLRGFTRDKKIPIDKVERVVAVEGTKGLTRPRFVVRYEKEGRIRKRYVLMPSKWLSFGEEELRRAKEVFREAGLPLEA